MLSRREPNREEKKRSMWLMVVWSNAMGGGVEVTEEGEDEVGNCTGNLWRGTGTRSVPHVPGESG